MSYDRWESDQSYKWQTFAKPIQTAANFWVLGPTFHTPPERVNAAEKSRFDTTMEMCYYLKPVFFPRYGNKKKCWTSKPAKLNHLAHFEFFGPPPKSVARKFYCWVLLCSQKNSYFKNEGEAEAASSVKK